MRIAKRPRARLDRALFAAAGVGLVPLAYARWVEPRRLETVTAALPLAERAAGAAPVRVVHLSDLHSPSNAAVHAEIVARVRALRPHAIAFTGDAVNHAGGLPAARALFAELRAIAPTFAVRGNRDAVLGDVSPFAGTGVVELDGASAPLDGVPGVAFVGASSPRGWGRVRAALRAAPTGTVTVLLGHSPDMADDAARWGADVYLAGHTHGGQVALPWYGALWTGSRFGKRFEAGRYRVGAMWLYITRGVGMEATLPKVRFLARPEVTALELRAGSGSTYGDPRDRSRTSKD